MAQSDRESVLVVDDEPQLRELCETVLRANGYAVLTARDGVEALEQIDRFRPHAMTLDLSMPRLDGMGVLERLADSPSRPRTMVLTARHAAADIERAIGLGAVDYLAKPFEPDQFLRRVARLMRRRAA